MDVSLEGEFSVASGFYTDRMTLWNSIFEELNSHQKEANDESGLNPKNNSKDEL